MQHFMNTYTSGAAGMDGGRQSLRNTGSWIGELNGGGTMMPEQAPMPMMPTMPTSPMMSTGQTMPMVTPGQTTDPALDMRHGQPSDVIEAPTSLNETYLGSLKSMLSQNKGNFVVATFLIGTQGMVSWEGILYEVGNDFVTIYQQGRDRYIVCDIYSLKYIEFYDLQRRQMCDAMLMQNPQMESGSSD